MEISSVKWIERSFSVLAIIVFTKAFTILVFTDLHLGPGGRSEDLAKSGPMTADHPVLLGIYLFLYSVSGLLLLRRFQELLKACLSHWMLVLLLILAFCSALWSIVPTITIARTTAMVGTTLFGVYLAMYNKPREQIELFAAAFVVVTLGSIATVLLFPEHGLMNHPHQGIWNGAFVHKNVFGMVMALSAVVFLFLSWTSSRLAATGYVGYWLSILLLILSSAKTACVALIATLSILALFLFFKSNIRQAVTACLGVTSLVAAICLQIYFETPAAHVLSSPAQEASAPHMYEGAQSGDVSTEVEVLATVSKDSLATATSRTPLWTFLAGYALEKPLLGYGFGGFWRRHIGPPASVEEELGWWPAQAHNGYLDLQLELGLIGLVAFICLYVAVVRREVIRVIGGSAPVDYFGITLIVLLSTINLAESQLFAPNSIIWIIFVMLLFNKGPESQRQLAGSGK